MSSTVEPDWVEHFNDLWEQLGPETKPSILGLLPDDWSFEGKRALDFGCGAGRTLKHFRAEAEVGELWGVDIDGPSIQELRDAMCPPLHAMQTGYWPPLALESDSFDLIWSISVFTHLTDNSIPWLLELHRLLKPGGLLIATFMGRWTSEVVAGEPWEEDQVGMNVVHHNHSASDGAPMTLISDWWLREHWGRAFDVLQIAPNIHNQSWALVRKREVSVTVEDVERPGDDPREYLALRHNLEQVQREVESLSVLLRAKTTEAEAKAAARRRAYVLSRRVTRGLRGGMNALRSAARARRPTPPPA